MMFKRKPMNKKGWMRVLEAVIAITILIGVLVYIMASNAPKNNISESVYEKETYILDTISKDEGLREEIINPATPGSYPNVDDAILKMIPETWDFKANVCDLEVICNAGVPVDKEVYASEVVISSTDSKYEPKKLTLFIWGK